MSSYSSGIVNETAIPWDSRVPGTGIGSHSLARVTTNSDNDKKITDKDILSYSLIKLLRFHNLSVGDIFTDEPQNREKLIKKPKNH